MLSATELKEVCDEILNLAFRLKYEGMPCVGISCYTMRLPHRDPELIRFALWYLQDKGLMRGSEITHKGVDYVLQNYQAQISSQ